jgi:hypothetical protein
MKAYLLPITIFSLIVSSSSFAQDTTNIDWIRIDSGVGTAVARDAADNVYKTFSNGIIYIRKLDKFGNFLWQQSFTTNVLFNYENPWRVFVDSKQNVIVVGDRHTHSIENGNRVNAIIVLKYSSSGTLLWQQIIDGYFSAFFQERYHNKISARLDARDNIYISSGGNFAGMSAGFNAIRINTNGNISWKRVQSFGSSPYYFVENIENKNKLLALSGFGQFTNNALLWVLDTAGNNLGTKQNAGNSGKDVAFDNTNNIYLLANTSTASDANMTIYKFRTNGTQAWVKNYDLGGYEGGYRIIFSPDNNLVVLGSGNHFPNGSLYSDWLTFKIDVNGNVLWNQRYDKHKNNDEFPADIVLDSSGNIFETGEGGPYPGGSNLGLTQWVTLKYSSAGALQWFVPIDTLGELASGVALTLDSKDNLFVVADENGSIIHLLQFEGTGSCGVPTNLSATNISADTAVIKWKAVPGAYLYHLEYKPSTSTTWIRISTDKNSYTLKNLFGGTQYDYHVQSICKTGLSAFSATKHFSTAGAGYCLSRGLNSTDEWIDLVFLSDMLNSTGNDGGYHDYTNRIATVAAGAFYDLTTSAEFSNGNIFTEGWSIWVDWNKDGDFSDANELIVRYKSQQIGWETHTFQVPSTASGLTKMRVAIERSNYSNPCDTFQRGDVEDYSINILPQSIIANAKQSFLNTTPSIITVSPNPAKDYLLINVPLLKGNNFLQVFDATGKLVMNKQTENLNQYKLDINKLNKGLYVLRVRNTNGKTESIKWMKE